MKYLPFTKKGLQEWGSCELKIKIINPTQSLSMPLSLSVSHVTILFISSHSQKKALALQRPMPAG
jgi:hypothetical protein